MRSNTVRRLVVVASLAAGPLVFAAASSPAHATWCPVSVGVGFGQPKPPQPVGGACVPGPVVNTSACGHTQYVHLDRVTGQVIYVLAAECGPSIDP